MFLMSAVRTIKEFVPGFTADRGENVTYVLLQRTILQDEVYLPRMGICIC